MCACHQVGCTWFGACWLAELVVLPLPPDTATTGSCTFTLASSYLPCALHLSGRVVLREFATRAEVSGPLGELKGLLAQLWGLMTKNPQFTDNASVSLQAVGSPGTRGSRLLAMSETPAASYIINPDDLTTQQQVRQLTPLSKLRARGWCGGGGGEPLAMCWQAQHAHAGLAVGQYQSTLHRILAVQVPSFCGGCCLLSHASQPDRGHLLCMYIPTWPIRAPALYA